MKKSKILAIILIGFCVAFIVVSAIILPNTVVTQITVSGENPTQLPKVVAILIPSALTLIGGAMEIGSKEDTDKLFTKQNIIAAIGIGVFIMMIVVNI